MLDREGENSDKKKDKKRETFVNIRKYTNLVFNSTQSLELVNPLSQHPRK